MSGYYPPNSNIPLQYYNVNPNLVPNPNGPSVPAIMTPDGSYAHGVPESPVYHAMSGPYVPYSDPHGQQAYVGQYEDVSGTISTSTDPNARARRRSAPGDHVKHRRTRSGCFTCRQRRVKVNIQTNNNCFSLTYVQCDETHPVCDSMYISASPFCSQSLTPISPGCTKGNRECVYPDPQSNQKSGRSGSKSGKPSSNEGSSPEDHDEDMKERLPPILDDEEDEGMETDTKGQEGEDGSDTPALTLDRSPSPSTDPSTRTPNLAARPPMPRKGSHQSSKPGTATKLGLDKDVQFYLEYFKNNISGHHYSIKHERSMFLKTDYLDHAMKYPPLLYAIVGYAAYFHTLSQPNGRIDTFLRYYNESVSRLRMHITKNKKQGLSTLLTILQLAAIEVGSLARCTRAHTNVLL